jgi:hypothetical protein
MIDEKPKDEDSYFHWRYVILKSVQAGETIYSVCEDLEGIGYTEAITPDGDSPTDLLITLEMMVSDVKECIKDNFIIEKDAPYDSWRLDKIKELDDKNATEWLKDVEYDDEDK